MVIIQKKKYYFSTKNIVFLIREINLKNGVIYVKPNETEKHVLEDIC
jgi:hypothetical protein